MKWSLPGGQARYLLVLAPYLGFLATWNLAGRIPITMICFTAGLAALIWARGLRPIPSLHVFLLVAVGVRMLALPLPPSLSEDVYRYIWDGRVAGAGFNPYLLAPEAPELADLRDDLWQALPHRDVATVYPPLAMALFSITARSAAPVLLWKLILAAVDVLTCLLLYRLAVRRYGDGGRAIWYAWNPLAVLEFSGMGHVDALGICAVVATVWALQSGRETTWSGLWASAAALAKLIPVLCIPVWWRHVRRRWLFAAVVILALGAALAPVAVASGGVPSGYLRFGGSWEFNGPLYEPLWRGLDNLDSSRAVESALEWLKRTGGDHTFWNRFFPHNYPRMHARTLLGVLFLALVVTAWRRRELVVGTGLVFEFLLLCSATVYPWYLLWLLPFAALTERPAWLVLCSLSFVSYVAQFTAIPLMPWVFLACWGPYAWIRARAGRWSAA